jgi:hypothetical protein
MTHACKSVSECKFPLVENAAFHTPPSPSFLFNFTKALIPLIAYYSRHFASKQISETPPHLLLQLDEAPALISPVNANSLVINLNCCPACDLIKGVKLNAWSLLFLVACNGVYVKRKEAPMPNL